MKEKVVQKARTELLYIGLMVRWFTLVDQTTRDRVLWYLTDRFGSKS